MNTSVSVCYFIFKRLESDIRCYVHGATQCFQWTWPEEAFDTLFLRPGHWKTSLFNGEKQHLTISMSSCAIYQLDFYIFVQGLHVYLPIRARFVPSPGWTKLKFARENGVRIFCAEARSPGAQKLQLFRSRVFFFQGKWFVSVHLRVVSLCSEEISWLRSRYFSFQRLFWVLGGKMSISL